MSPVSFPIVGIGASAGGLEAMTQLLRELPGATGLAFVLVQHLDPTHESALSALLARATSMPVCEAKDNMRLEPNQLYVLPPNKLMSIAGRKLKLRPRKDNQETRLPIDHFMRSLATEEGRSAIGVILSGNGSDGTLGLQAIKTVGGITFAQDETTAKFSNMPGSAITARCVDFVLSPERIARELTRIAGHPYVARSEAVDRPLPALTEERAFDDILTTLRHRTGVDFTHYKRATLERRIQRRMVLHRFEKLMEYAVHVHGHAAEAKELFNDILIHVTSFFRDPAVFTALKKKVFPRLLKAKRANESIRIWIPGCSTGEEVYSIVIALLESLTEKPAGLSIQIFGTDINDVALEKARAGLYPDSIQDNVSAERLRRFFVRSEGGYRISKSVRDLCIFARQNVVTDPPFSSLDLISCRNVLIYLGQPLQRKIMPVFHYALRPTGLLLLGASESIGSFAELFALWDKKVKVYTKKTTHLRPPVSFQPFFQEPRRELSPPAAVGTDINDIQKHADRILLSNYSPAGVIINSDLDVLQFRGRTGAFLEHAQGEATLNLLKMAREGLATDLRTALSKAMKQNVRIRQPGARVNENGRLLEVDIEVVPFQVPPSHEWFYLVLLNASRPPASDQPSQKSREKTGKRSRSELELARLREELAGTRASLQAIVEEQEATNEELRSANEEILSSNEELQSTNEELETAKEELQSTNEELTTLNEELETRNTEMMQINNDLHNVLASARIPMLILGRDLRIRRFTSAAENLLNLIPSDVGRPITDIAMNVELADLPKIITEVIDSLTTRDIETRDKAGHYWSVRIRPYKTTENRIEGAVIALVDVDAMTTNLRQSEQERAFAEAIVNTVREPLIVLDQQLMVKHVNEAFLRMFKVSAGDTVNRRIYDLGNGQWNVPRLRHLLEEVLPRNSSFTDFEVEHEFPRIGMKKMFLNARKLSLGGNQQQLILLALEDATGLSGANS